MVVKSNEWTPPLESRQTSVLFKDGKVRAVYHAKAAGVARNVRVTPELNEKYVALLATRTKLRKRSTPATSV
jgi:hypothetical protein